MPRSTRYVAPGVAHHITQRGTDRQTVFHSRADRLTYLHLLRQQASLADMRFWSESGGAERWRVMLSQGDGEAEAQALRRATYSGQPFGDEEFVETLRTQREKARASGGPAPTSPSAEPLVLAAQ